jgi:IclR family acetate operon transcriptional repressor
MAASPRRAAINSSASHVFEVLRFVAESPEPLGVTEISRRLSLPVSTVYRALVTLEEGNYIQRYQNTPRFELGMMPHLVNRALLNRFALHAYSRPALHALAAESGYTVSLWCRLGWYALRIGGAFGSHDIFHRARLGETQHLHRGPGPAAILAYLPADQRRAFVGFAERHFPQHAPSPAGWSDLEERLAALRERGFAREALSIARDFHAIALPIRDAQDTVVASLMTEGATIEGGTIEPSEAMLATRHDIEVGIRLEPERFTLPFVHIAPDDIVIRILNPAD